MRSISTLVCHFTLRAKRVNWKAYGLWMAIEQWLMPMPMPNGKTQCTSHHVRFCSFCWIGSERCGTQSSHYIISMMVYHSIMCAKHVYLLWLSASHVTTLIFQYFTHKISCALFQANVKQAHLAGRHSNTTICLNNRRHRSMNGSFRTANVLSIRVLLIVQGW